MKMRDDTRCSRNILDDEQCQSRYTYIHRKQMNPKISTKVKTYILKTSTLPL